MILILDLFISDLNSDNRMTGSLSAADVSSLTLNKEILEWIVLTLERNSLLQQLQIERFRHHF